MRKLVLITGLLGAALVSGPVFADYKIAYVDPEVALGNTEQAKKMADQMNAKLKPQRDRLTALKKEIEDLETKAQHDASIMSDKDKHDLEQKGDADMQEFQLLKQDAEKQLNDAREQLVQKMYPKMQAAMDELQKAGGYDLILLRSSVVRSGPGMDLTQKLTDKLNASDKADGK